MGRGLTEGGGGGCLDPERIAVGKDVLFDSVVFEPEIGLCLAASSALVRTGNPLRYYLTVATKWEGVGLMLGTTIVG